MTDTSLLKLNYGFLQQAELRAIKKGLEYHVKNMLYETYYGYGFREGVGKITKSSGWDPYEIGEYSNGKLHGCGW